MADVLFFPPFPSRPQLFDQLFRSIWHFLPALPKLGRLIFPYAGDDFALLDTAQILDLARVYMSRDLDPAIAFRAPRFAGKIAIEAKASRNPADYPSESFRDLKGVIVWTCDADSVAAARAIAAAAGVPVVLADPVSVQQETLLVMRFVYQLFSQEELSVLAEACYDRFRHALARWQGQKFSGFGNGPSLGKVVAAKLDVGPGLRAVCNSTIGDEAALAHLKPAMLFCGDPVQHCGASLYAGRFRQDLARAMAGGERVLFTQLGYLPYFDEVLPEAAQARVIGIGNDRRPKFNLDIAGEFITAATANIFTMLVLPVAFTFAKQVDIFGCDGMAFAQAAGPWSHADETDYMGKMAVTHRVHPGFWQRNYEEEYWSYCQDMEEIIGAAEARGIQVTARTPSFVPALAKRYQPIA